jgi:tRNA-intron lyase
MEVGFRRPRHKRRRRHDIQTDKLRIYAELKSKGLKGLILDSAVWVCASHATVKALDHACLGNLDGGDQMTTYLKDLLGSSDDVIQDGKTVRLSLDEAFFMHYALGALELFDQSPRLLDTGEIWERMCSSRADFPLSYVCYHHFRSKGWIPRTGLQYGVDFVLYQKHPALAHSDYSVTIQTPHVSTGVGGSSLFRPPLSWHDLQVTNRMTGQVGKRLLIVNIHDPAPDLGYTNHRCIDRIAISEYVIRRWVPERGI